MTEFLELGERYHMRGVLRTMIGELVSVEDAALEGQLLAKLLEAQRQAVPLSYAARRCNTSASLGASYR